MKIYTLLNMRKGNIDFLKKLAKKYSYKLKVVKPVVGRNKTVFN